MVDTLKEKTVAGRPTNTETIRKLKAENEKLAADNKRLQKLSSKDQKPGRWPRIMRRIGFVFFTALTVALLVIGNIVFWSGKTLVKSDHFAAATAPIIADPAVQTAVADYSTKQIFASVDVETLARNALPERASFLAPTIASQAQSQTKNVITNILARPEFAENWNKALLRAHTRFINSVKNHGSDGSIDIGEVYTQISSNLQNTKLSFLANKPLPQKVGSIKLVEGKWLSTLSNVINNIDTWRNVTILLFVLSGFLAVLLSTRRRKALIILSLFLSAGMFLSLITFRLAREQVANSIDPLYSDAVRNAWQIFFHPLAVQTTVIIFTMLLVAFVTWISGTGKNASLLRERIQLLFSGKLHQAVFKKENAFTIKLGAHKSAVQWTFVALTAFFLLFAQATPKTLILSALGLLVLVLLVEVLSAPKPKTN